MNISKINPIANTSFKQSYNNIEGQDTRGMYDVSHKFTVATRGKSDYSTKTGDYSVAIKGFLPIVKRKELYYPSKETFVIIRRTKEGIEKTTKTPTVKVTQMFDKSAILKSDKDFSILDEGPLDIKNGEIKRLTETTLGSKYLLRYDKDLNRKIYVEDKPEGRKAKITDAKTGKPITSGDGIYDRYRNDDDEEIIENLLTGKVVQKTQFRYKSSKIQHQVKYYEKTDNPRYIYNYNNSTGQTIEKYLNKAGKVTRLEITRPSDKSKEIYEYDDEGNIVAHTEEIYGFSLSERKPVVGKIIYNPQNSDIIRTIKKRGNNTIITEFSSSEKAGENYPITIEYLKDKKLRTFEKLQHGGEYVLSRTEFNKLNEASYKKFDEDGRLESINYFDKKGNITTSLDFLASSGRLASVTKYKPEGKGYNQYIYSNLSKYPINIVRVDGNNQIKKLTLNLDNKNNPKELLSSYFEDGNFDMDWQNKTSNNTDRIPALPKNRQETLSLTNELDEKSKNALGIRQRNFRRLG